MSGTCQYNISVFAGYAVDAGMKEELTSLHKEYRELVNVDQPDAIKRKGSLWARALRVWAKGNDQSPKPCLVYSRPDNEPPAKKDASE